jgi:hypothetical protein
MTRQLRKSGFQVEVIDEPQPHATVRELDPAMIGL